MVDVGERARLVAGPAALLLLLACGPPQPAGSPPPSARPPPGAPRAAAPPVTSSGDASAARGAPRFVDTLDATTFQRGNLHAHSTESDGDAAPETLYAWYRDHGYAFLALSDHNRRTDPAKYAGLARPGFALVPAEEITMAAHGAPVHVNAICHRRKIGGARFEKVEEALAWAVRRAHEEGGVALVNHPNFHWAITASELAGARGAELLEIWSGHPNVHTLGDATRPSHEAIWDAALTAGLDFAPAAVDDTHKIGAVFARGATAEENRRASLRAGPGRAWVDVAAATATVPAICEALRRRHVVASNGPRLTRLRVAGDALALSVAPGTGGAAGGVVEFVGARGVVLETQPIAQENAYHLRGDEAFVRARVVARDKTRLWTPAFRVTSRP